MKEEKFETWAIVDLFGHTRVVGKVTEQTIGGIPFLRVDVPEIGEVAPHTRFFGNGAIYSMTPVSEDVAMKVAAHVAEAPVKPWEVRQIEAPPARPAGGDDDDHEDLYDLERPPIDSEDY